MSLVKDPFVLDDDKVEEISRSDDEDISSQEEEPEKLSNDDIISDINEKLNGKIPEEFSEVDEKVEKMEDDVDSEGFTDVLGSGRLRKKTIKAGQPDSAQPREGDSVEINFKVLFEEDTKLEESGFKFHINEGEVPTALDLAVPLMALGEIALVIADPEFAYGSHGCPPKIPGKAAVTFEIELVAIDDSRPSVEEMSLEERMSVGKRKKDRGSFWVKIEDYPKAILAYRKSLEYLNHESIDLEVPIDRFGLAQDLQELLAERVKSFNNLTLCQLKIEAYDSALISVKNVLKVDPNNEKALFRKSKALQNKGQTEEALGVLRRVSRLYPDNAQAKLDIQRLSAKVKKSRANEEQMYKKMFEVKKSDESSGSFFPPDANWKTLLASTGFVFGSFFLVGAVAYVTQKFELVS